MKVVRATWQTVSVSECKVVTANPADISKLTCQDPLTRHSFARYDAFEREAKGDLKTPALGTRLSCAAFEVLFGAGSCFITATGTSSRCFCRCCPYLGYCPVTRGRFLQDCRSQHTIGLELCVYKAAANAKALDPEQGLQIVQRSKEHLSGSEQLGFTSKARLVWTPALVCCQRCMGSCTQHNVPAFLAYPPKGGTKKSSDIHYHSVQNMQMPWITNRPPSNQSYMFRNATVTPIVTNGGSLVLRKRWRRQGVIKLCACVARPETSASRLCPPATHVCCVTRRNRAAIQSDQLPSAAQNACIK